MEPNKTKVNNSLNTVRRLLWTSPIVAAVALPVHAQTSCSEQDIVGDWTVGSVTATNSDLLNLIVTLQLNGIGIVNPPSHPFFQSLKWSQSGSEIRINLFGDNGGTINEVDLVGTINIACNEISGDVISPPIAVIGQFTLIKS